MNGIELIKAERERQTNEEGWTAEHDSQHRNDELVGAAMYFTCPENFQVTINRDRGAYQLVALKLYPNIFFPCQWDKKWAKRDKKTRVEQLTIAGALIAAEIDRLLLLETSP